MFDERPHESITSVVNERISKERQWLESQGLKVKTEISFGSSQWGEVKKGVSDVDVFFLLENDNLPSGKDLTIEPDGEPGLRFTTSVDFDKEFPIKKLESQCFSPSRVLHLLDRFISELNSGVSPTSIVTTKEKGVTKNMTHREFIAGFSWLYQVFKIGKVVDGDVPDSILRKVQQVDIAYARYMNGVTS